MLELSAEVCMKGCFLYARGFDISKVNTRQTGLIGGFDTPESRQLSTPLAARNMRAHIVTVRHWRIAIIFGLYSFAIRLLWQSANTYQDPVYIRLY